MTSKHYVMIARTLRAKIDAYASVDNMSAVNGITETAYALARTFQIDNPRFDLSRFVTAATGKVL